MIKPTKYKSISTTQLKLRRIDALTNTEKTKVNTILQKLSDLIKLKHSS
jgi:hypothetical protein